MASVWGRPRSKSSCKENSSERAWPVTEEQALGLICMSPPTHTHGGASVAAPAPPTDTVHASNQKLLP